MAFAAMQMQQSALDRDVMKIDWRPLYDSAARHLSSALAKQRKNGENDGVKEPLKYFLTSLFLLTYTDVSPARYLAIRIHECSIFCNRWTHPSCPGRIC